jgi:hypothetical protein
MSRYTSPLTGALPLGTVMVPKISGALWKTDDETRPPTRGLAAVPATPAYPMTEMEPAVVARLAWNVNRYVVPGQRDTLCRRRWGVLLLVDDMRDRKEKDDPSAPSACRSAMSPGEEVKVTQLPLRAFSKPGFRIALEPLGAEH